MDAEHADRQCRTRHLHSQQPAVCGSRPYGKQTYRKSPETGKRHAFINPEEKRSDHVESPAPGIVPLELWDWVKSRQATLAHTANPRTEMAGLPFFAQQRPRYLLTGKMTCGSCGASYAELGKTRSAARAPPKRDPPDAATA